MECYDSVVGGATLVTIASTSTVLARSSHILNGGALTVESSGTLPSRVMDLAGNWWGTDDAATIESWISDANGNVTYEPFLTGPVSTEVESVGSLKALFDELGPE